MVTANGASVSTSSPAWTTDAADDSVRPFDIENIAPAGTFLNRAAQAPRHQHKA